MSAGGIFFIILFGGLIIAVIGKQISARKNKNKVETTDEVTVETKDEEK